MTGNVDDVEIPSEGEHKGELDAVSTESSERTLSDLAGAGDGSGTCAVLMVIDGPGMAINRPCKLSAGITPRPGIEGSCGCVVRGRPFVKFVDEVVDICVSSLESPPSGEKNLVAPARPPPPVAAAGDPAPDTGSRRAVGTTGLGARNGAAGCLADEPVVGARNPFRARVLCRANQSLTQAFPLGINANRYQGGQTNKISEKLP